MNDKDYLGKGMKFPIQVNKAIGRFVLATEESSVKESIYVILMTQKSERWVRPNFGSQILSYTFMDTSLTRIQMMSRELEQTILEQEPRVSDVNVSVEPHLDRGCLIINIVYTVAKNNTKDNLVFPFYLNAEIEGEEDGGYTE